MPSVVLLSCSLQLLLFIAFWLSLNKCVCACMQDKFPPVKCCSFIIFCRFFALYKGLLPKVMRLGPGKKYVLFTCLVIFTLPPLGVWSTVMSMSVCKSARTSQKRHVQTLLNFLLCMLPVAVAWSYYPRAIWLMGKHNVIYNILHCTTYCIALMPVQYVVDDIVCP